MERLGFWLMMFVLALGLTAGAVALYGWIMMPIGMATAFSPMSEAKRDAVMRSAHLFWLRIVLLVAVPLIGLLLALLFQGTARGVVGLLTVLATLALVFSPGGPAKWRGKSTKSKQATVLRR